MRTTIAVTTPLPTLAISSTTLFQELDLRVGNRLVLHDLRAAKRIAPMNHVTFDANFVRKIASSIAESPPPTTAIGLIAI